MRIEVEHALRDCLERLGGEIPQNSMRELVAKVEHAGGLLAHSRAFLEHLPLLNRAVHGLDVASDDTVRAADTAAELQTARDEDV